MAKTHYRTLWLSDIHLGSQDCKAEQLLDFLDSCTFDTLYLNGDIIDMWALQKQFRWPKAHNQLLHRLIAFSDQGVRVIYLPGNHDEPAQKYDGMVFGSIDIHRQTIHTTASGKKLLLVHGDQFDNEVCFGRLQSWIGDKGYTVLMFLNRWYNRIRSKLGYNYWSLAGYIKSHIRGANHAIDRYRSAALKRADSLNLDGIVCGHIHHPEMTQEKGLSYYNSGDWVENCSALIEDEKGEIELVFWTTPTSSITPINEGLLPIVAKQTDQSSQAA